MPDQYPVLPLKLLRGERMSEYYDRYETRLPKTRESSLLRDLKAIVSLAKSRAPGLRKQIRGFNIAEIRKREDLARFPLIRKSDLRILQADEPPYGGLVASRPGVLRYMWPDGVAGQARDWWGAARALCAAGFARGDVIINCFSYHLSTRGHMIDSGAAALGCTVIPAGNAKLDRLLDAIHHLRPDGYCGKPDFLRQLLERATELNRDVSSIRRALVFGAHLDNRLRRDIEARGIHLRQAYATSDLGIVAYETDGPDGSRNEGMMLNEGLILEILRPGTEEPAAVGEVGELVVTRLNADYPLLRLATGDLSVILPGLSPCGRTNVRIAGWLGRVDQIVTVNGKRVMPSDIIKTLASSSEVARGRLIVTARGADPHLTMQVEADQPDANMESTLGRQFHALVGLKCDIAIIKPGALADTCHLISDERGRAT